MHNSCTRYVMLLTGRCNSQGTFFSVRPNLTCSDYRSGETEIIQSTYVSAIRAIQFKTTENCRKWVETYSEPSACKNRIGSEIRIYYLFHITSAHICRLELCLKEITFFPQKMVCFSRKATDIKLTFRYSLLVTFPLV